MVQSMQETERKYEVPSSSDTSWLPPLDRVEGVTSVVDRSIEELDAVYYDTDDLRLSGSSAILRRRTGGSDAGWHLKLPLPGDSREEVQAALTDAVPDALRDLALSRTRGAELTPVVRIRSTREVRDLVDAEGGVLAELSIDAVRAQSLRAQGRSAAWREMEVELAEDADPALLDAVEKRLREHGIARAQSSSKLARALDEMAPVPAGERDEAADLAPGSAGEQVLAYVREQIRVLTALDPAVRRDRPDSVHRMRVACRRLRSCLRSYRSVLDREVTDAIRGDLKWLASELGAERDQEVLMKRLTRGVKALPGELVLGPVSARLQAWNVARGSESHQRSLGALGSRRYLALLGSLAALGQQPPLRAKAGKAADKVMAKAVLKEFDRLAQRMAPALDLPPGPERDVALHEARKAAKKVRYAAEAARPTLGKPAKRLGKRVKAAQKVLGDHQDSVVARGTIRDLAVAAQTTNEAGFTWGVLYGGEQAVAHTRERELLTVWERASAPKLRKRLSR
ncbi:CYTH and CHAD domain-containing protein [Streptomyces sp. NBC_01446]|uniref:CYTH and CHAD domain-containing protein n=1 Tax=Streptomyces sp. NBC_00119 TaxID=2975659 RepID=A0AAU1TX09_9ACTN|nr:CYTH and CHAD domain-containing protein [Streptomyces sp. NBC_01446]MCX4648194.1 CYTH and CHAD domain-containing protein [Streptomyces sp. NBC_01446]